ncbi:MAG: holo-[acyl-carrier-protein] synthase [Halieaceae bacterium]|nr:holo-[acyl-carrier-protein] synthase [Halieaceae bacterium]
MRDWQLKESELIELQSRKVGESAVVQGIGLDIVKIDRIEAVYRRFGDRFARKVLSAEELSAGPVTSSLIAKRFAAKEAIVKALGTGFRGGITMPSITINKNSLNKPQVALTGAAAERLRVIGAQQVLVSIADEVDSVVAFAIAQ